MSIETNAQHLETNPDKKLLYPERVSCSAEKNLKEILGYLYGDKEKEELTDDEKLKLIAFEEPFVDKLSTYTKLATGKKVLYPEYFDTPEGQATLRGIYEFTSLEGHIDIRKNISTLRTLKADQIKSLVEISTSWNDTVMIETLFQNINIDTGELNIEGVQNPEKLTYIQNPEKLKTKLEGLESIKLELKEILSILYKEEAYDTHTNNKYLLHAKIFRVKALIKRINVLIAETREQETFLDTKKPQHSHKPPYKLDKFIYGVSSINTNTGNYQQVDNHLLVMANSIAELNTSINQKKSDILLEQNIDKDKFEAKSITPEIAKHYVDQILASYELLSEYPANAEQVANNVKPPDNKWRCYIRGGTSTLKLESKSKTLLLPDVNIDIQKLITKVATHEIIHILQRENTAEIGLPLYSHSDQIAGDRAEIFQEGGAMYYQDKASQELFGYESPPQPNYLRAMVTKQSGGTYIDCVKTYYKSIRSLEPEQVNSVKLKDFIKKALSGSLRLFRNSSFDNTDNQISNTKDTAYLEQKAVVEEILKYPELQNLILVSGINLETAKEMIRFGLLDLSKLRTPDLSFVQKIWEEEKHKYTLDSPALDSPIPSSNPTNSPN